MSKRTSTHSRDSTTKDRSFQGYGFIERYFFYPKLWHKILALLLLPFSFIYYLIAVFRKKCARKRDFEIKILSIGNLVSGGSGKTPFCIALARHLESLGYTDIFVILRGYKRSSRGLLRVSNNGEILCDVRSSGDEAMLIAKCIAGSVLVSEKREIALHYAKEHNAQIILLDDAYRFCFRKFDILLEPETTPYFPYVLPSGYYRFPPSFYKKCDLHLKEGVHYKRFVQLNPMSQAHNWTKQKDKACLIFATAIANPTRLLPYLPQNVVCHYFLPDHANFCEEDLTSLLVKHNASYILMTQKDYVKCTHFSLPIVVLDLYVEIDSFSLQIIESYLHAP